MIACHRLSRLFPNIVDIFTHFALHVAERKTTAKETALYRMSSLHQSCSRMQLEPGVAAAAALYIQSHIPAASSDVSVRQLYLANKNPETYYVNTHTCFPFRTNLPLAEKAWHAQPHEDTGDVLAKLMRKGGPAPSSVRYVAGLVRRCAHSNPKVLKDMICSHYLGGYYNSTTVAHPQQHIMLLNMTIDQLVNYAVATCTTRQLHYMVSEFVCANTNEHAALLWSVGTTAAQHVQNVARGTLRAFGRHTKLVKTSGFSCIMTLAKALNAFNATKSVHLLSVSEITAASACVGMISPLPLMQNLEIGTEQEWEKIQECTENPKHTSLKAMRLQLKKIHCKTRQFLTLCIFHCIKSMRVRVTPCSASVQRAQTAALTRANNSIDTTLSICTCCTTLRSAVLGAKTPKTRAGVSIDLGTATLYCNNCSKSEGIMQIVMAGRFVTLMDRHLDPARGVGPITVCCSCGFLTIVHKIIGEYPFCTKCADAITREHFKPRPCFCGAHGHTWTHTQHASGAIVMDWVCKHHTHCIPDQIVSRDVLIETFSADLQKNGND